MSETLKRIGNRHEREGLESEGKCRSRKRQRSALENDGDAKVDSLDNGFLSLAAVCTSHALGPRSLLARLPLDGTLGLLDGTSNLVGDTWLSLVVRGRRSIPLGDSCFTGGTKQRSWGHSSGGTTRWLCAGNSLLSWSSSAGSRCGGFGRCDLCSFGWCHLF